MDMGALLSEHFRDLIKRFKGGIRKAGANP